MTNIGIKSSSVSQPFLIHARASMMTSSSTKSRELATSNEPDFNALLAQLRPVVDLYAKEMVIAWTQRYQEQLQDFIDILEEATNSLSQQGRSNVSAGQTRQAMNQLYTSMLEWVDAVSSLPPNHLWRGLQKSFKEELAAVPETVTIPLPKDFWTTIENPSFRLKLCSKQVQIIRGLKKVSQRPLGHLQRVTRLPLSFPLVDHRQFRPRAFFRYFLELPTAKFLLWEWFQFLQLVAKQHYLLHQKTIEIRDELLLMNVFHSSLQQMEGRQLTDAAKKLRIHIQEIRSLFLEVEQFENTSWERYEVHQQNLYQTAEAQWSVAGTAILSESAFSKHRIAKHWQQLALQARKGEASWLNHLNAEYSEWQSSLEIAVLQLNIVHHYHDIKAELAENVELQLKPVFQKANKTINDLIKQVYGLSSGEKQAPHTTMTLIKRHCQTLQQKRIPLMMDTLIQSKLDNLGEGLDRQLRSLIEALPDEHIIFLKRDLVNLFPKSQTDKMYLLKAIILDEIFVEFEQAYQSFQTTHQNRLE